MIEPTAWQAPTGGIPDDALGAFCRDNHVTLRGAELGPLVSLRFGAKDVFHAVGARTGFGQPDWLRTHEAATENAHAIQKLLDAGAEMVGKTVTDELAYSLSGENFHYGTPVNIRDPNRTPGGSSSGSAAAVAGGLVSFAIGTDCGGSVRLPASYCGILGMRPTHGRVSLQGAVSFAPSFDTAGWFASNADFFERVGHVLLDPADAVRVQLNRLIVVEDAFDHLEEETRRTLLSVADSLSRYFPLTSKLAISGGKLAEWSRAFQTIQAFEIWANHGEWIRRTKPQFGPGVKERFESASQITLEDMINAQTQRRQILRVVGDIMTEGAVLCLPTSPRIAPLRGSPVEKVEIEYRHQAMCLLCIAGLNGFPQINLPLAVSNGLPLGISLIGGCGTDEELMALARTIMNDVKHG